VADIRVIGNKLSFDGKTYRCVVGKGGISTDKREGDGATPVGVFPLRECWYRADRVEKSVTRLPLRVIHKLDGWCDDPKNHHYNKYIKIRGEELKYSYEQLWRDDHAYDILVVLGYNDHPVVPGKGSAIFLHLMHEDERPTEGCVALKSKDLLEILPQLGQDISLEVLPPKR
jgi:L,D-peptidoglycan transpeptidase YkuD (ErfK/YbiS/YcfS/YnhG family)